MNGNLIQFRFYDSQQFFFNNINQIIYLNFSNKQKKKREKKTQSKKKRNTSNQVECY